MNLTPLSWLLAGALAASLWWNFRSAEPPAELPGCERPPAGELACGIDPEELGLDEPTVAALRGACGASCATAASLERRADQRYAELSALLSGETVEREQAEALAREIGELRARALQECVAGILAVREHLPPEQVARLFERCSTALSAERTE